MFANKDGVATFSATLFSTITYGLCITWLGVDAQKYAADDTVSQFCEVAPLATDII
jgi:hypothetical protein